MKKYELSAVLYSFFEAYELVMFLKKLKDKGYRYIYCGDIQVHLGKLMQHIVSMNKKHLSYNIIVAELLESKCFYDK